MGWEVRDSADGPRLVRELMAIAVIYGCQPVAEAERGRRGVHRVWRAPETSSAELERLCGSPDHQGVVAEVDHYPYGDPGGLLRRRDALLVALDQVQDPRNLGAVCRSAEVGRRGRAGVPERRAATVTAAACKASAGAVEHLEVAHVRNLADWLGDAEGRWLLDLGRRRRGRGGAVGVDLQGPTVLVLGGEGKGLRPRVAASCDGLSRCPNAAGSTP